MENNKISDIDNIKILFNLVKNHKWDKLIEFLKENDDVDVNIRDDSNNYLINYAVIFNNLDAMSLLIHRGSKLDIIDNDGRSILYIPIKYGFIKMLNLLLYFNKTNIGISLIDIKDKNNNIPIHYAIEFNNIEAIKLLIENGSDMNDVDNNEFNSLHLAIQTENIDIVKLILNTRIDINARINTGENALHLASNYQNIEICKLLINAGININARDFENEFSSLDYSINNNNYEITKLLLDNDIDINGQDFFGNTAIHYSIKEKNDKITNLILNHDKIKNKINLNLYNVNSQLPIHIFLENIDDNNNSNNGNSNNNDNNLLKTLIEKSDLNFQDINNISPLYLIVIKNLWKNNKNILKFKKMNVFLRDDNNKRIIDYVKEDDFNEFIDLIVESYLNIIKSKNVVWKEKWENICKKDLDFTKEDINELNKYIDKNNTNNNTKNNTNNTCSNIIRKKLNDIYLNKSSKCGYTSYPQKIDKRCITIDEGKRLEVCTFTGISLDILFGLLYLLNKYPNVCSTIDDTFMDKTDICKYYENIGMSNSTSCEFVNFEIIWTAQKIYISKNFKNNFIKCINDKKSYIIVPIGIQLNKGSHSNYLIYDVKKKEIERFEPYGSNTPYNFNYNPSLLDNILKYRFKNIDEDIEYIKPSDYLPKIGFQYFDMLEGSTKKIGDPGGFCALWSLWYVDQRITYPDIPRKSLIRKLMKSVKSQGLYFRNIIRNYSNNIIELRDKSLNKVNLTINDWINEQYTSEQYKKIIEDITDQINNLSNSNKQK